MSLKQSIESLAEEFVDGILNAIRGASIEELSGGSTPTLRVIGPKPAKAKKAARLVRRSAEEIGESVYAVVKLLRGHADGLRSEQIREELGLDVREVPRVLKQGIADKAIAVLGGNKRSTLYGIKAKSKPAAKKKAVKKVVKKKVVAKKKKKSGKAVVKKNPKKKAPKAEVAVEKAAAE